MHGGGPRVGDREKGWMSVLRAVPVPAAAMPIGAILPYLDGRCQGGLRLVWSDDDSLPGVGLMV